MMFLNAYNTFMGDRERVIEDCELMRQALIDFTELDEKIEKQQAEVEVIADKVKILVKENASTPQSQDEYIQKYEGLSKRYEEEYGKLENLQRDKELRKSKDKAMEVFIENLKKQPLVVVEWDESLWALMIEKAVVSKDGSINFIFYNGTEIREEV
jgi:predicted nuclease with TOPRIM domain